MVAIGCYIYSAWVCLILRQTLVLNLNFPVRREYAWCRDISCRTFFGRLRLHLYTSEGKRKNQSSLSPHSLSTRRPDWWASRSHQAQLFLICSPLGPGGTFLLSLHKSSANPCLAGLASCPSLQCLAICTYTQDPKVILLGDFLLEVLFGGALGWNFEGETKKCPSDDYLADHSIITISMGWVKY